MLKNAMWASLAMLIAVPLSATAQDGTTTEKKHKLEYKFAQGQTDKYRVRITGSNSGMMSLTLKGEMMMEQKDKSYDADKKVGKVTQNITSVKLNLDMGGQKQEYDTEKGGGAEGNLLKGAAENIKGESTLTVQATGKVDKVESKKSAKANPLKAALGASAIPYDMVRLPAKEVKVGDTWTFTSENKVKDSMGQESVMKIKYTYTLKRVANKDGDDIATITMVITPDLKVMPGGMGGKVTKAGGKGSASFNMTKGYLRSCNYSVSIEGKSEFAEGDAAKMKSKQGFNIRRIEKKEK
ncbi:MAG: hypothetical protein P1V97_35805 [Planctomycetota bacterium]|nr:hypothetical protein [Planctomycetota bacterium]